MKISSNEAFLTLHKWQIDLTPIVFVGSLTPSNPLRGQVAVVTREGVWNSGDRPAAIWGFLLTDKDTSFLASKFEAYEFLQLGELPSDIAVSLPKSAPERGVLALRQIQSLVNTSARADEDRLTKIEETLYLVEDDFKSTKR
jgi:hypothetical protein